MSILKLNSLIFISFLILSTYSLKFLEKAPVQEEILSIKDAQSFLSFLQHNPQNDKELQQKLQNLADLLNLNTNSNNIYASKTSCLKCHLTVDGVRLSGIRKKLLEKSEEFAEYLCEEKLHLFPKEVCEGAIKEEAPFLINSLFDHYINKDILCPALKMCDPVYEKVDIDALVADIIKDKPEKEQLIPKLDKTFKFLHISDLHTSNQYGEQFKQNCEDPVCCIPDSGLAEKEQEKAGYWGSLSKCDLPTRTIQKLMNFIKTHLSDIEFALWTGDNTSHNIWEQSYEQNIQNSKTQTKIIKQTLPNLQVFPIMGNHESFPVNIYEFYEKKEEKFQKFFGDLWEDWIGPEAAQSLRDHSFYEVQVPNHNLKLIALNTQAGDKDNYSLIRDPTDPNHMLEKLRIALKEAEKNNQAVYIMSHIPSGDNLLPTFARVFSAIIDRYSYTIRAIFTGHTHADHYELYYGTHSNKVVAVNWITPSVTTFDFRNPSVRTIEVDSETYQVINIHQYRLDIEHWNKYTDPNTELIWDKAYDFLSEYNLSNLWDLENLEKLKNQIASNLEVFNKYNFNKHSGNYKDKSEIDPKVACQINGTGHQVAKCLGEMYIPSVTGVLSGPWIQKIKKQTNQQENLDSVY